MVPVTVPAPLVCVVEHCPAAMLARYKAFSSESLRMKALQAAPAFPLSRQTTMPDDTPTGGGSGGGAILGGEGAPGSGTGVPGAFSGAKPF